MPSNFIVAVTCYDTDGVTAKADVTVTLRSESTNDSLSGVSNSAGGVNFNLADLSNGWNTGDKFTVFVLYQGYEDYASFTHAASMGGGTTVTLTLVALAAAPSLRYFAVQDFLDYFNVPLYESDAEAGVKLQQVVKVGQMVEAQIDSDTGQVFDTNGGSYYSVTSSAYEYHDSSDPYGQKFFYLKKLPVYLIDEVSTTQSAEGNTPSWDVVYNRTAGTGSTDYFSVDNKTGRVGVLRDALKPASRVDALRAAYRYGQATPSDVKLLAVMWTGVELFGASFLKGKMFNFDDTNFNGSALDAFRVFRQSVVNKYRVRSSLIV